MDVPGRWIPVAVGAGFALFGTVFLVVGIRLARARRRFLATAVPTTGLCVDLEYRSGPATSLSDSATTGGWAPRMRFTTLDGVEVEATSGTWSNPAAVRRGQTAPVRYDPADPRRFHVDNLRGSAGCVPPVFVAVGSVFVLVGLVVLAVGVVVLSRS